LGCTNDASAVRPLLGRLIDTASQLLIQEQQISEPLKVPQDWWELVFKVGEVFALISCWIQRHGCRWILVLDGLDRLDQDDQQALPWISTTLPPGIHIVASALDCPARSILHERAYLALEIGPLGEGEQQQLIERYLGRYTKQLESGLQQKILAHPLAGSPLFLKVLLEELRQCAGFDTLTDQLEFYLFAESIDGLYGKVLERLEHDGHGEATRQALTALWGSRAGLSETELMAITGLAPVQWAPVDLALEEAFGRNGERLVFGHEFVRQAVERRYLPGRAEQQEAHGALAEWFERGEGWDERVSTELPYQLLKAGRTNHLKKLLLIPGILSQLQLNRGSREVASLWIGVKPRDVLELDELIAEAVEEEILNRTEDADDLIKFIDSLAAVLDEMGLQRELLLRLRTLSLETEEARGGLDNLSTLQSQILVADAILQMGNYKEAKVIYTKCLESCELVLGHDHPTSLMCVNNLAVACHEVEEFGEAVTLNLHCLQARKRLLGDEHPYTLVTIGNLGLLHESMGNYKKAAIYLTQSLEARKKILGPEHPETLTNSGNLGLLYASMGDHEKAEDFYTDCLKATEDKFGTEHHSTLIIIGNLAGLYQRKSEFIKAETLFRRSYEGLIKLLGEEHPEVCNIRFGLAQLLSELKRYDESIPLRQLDLQIARQANSSDTPDTLNLIHQLAEDLYYNNELDECEKLYREALTGRITILGEKDKRTTSSRHGLANCLTTMKRYREASELRLIVLTLSDESNLLHEERLIAMHSLGCDLLSSDEAEEALDVLQQCLNLRSELLGSCDDATLDTHNKLQEALVALGMENEAIALSESLLQKLLVERGPNDPGVFDELARQAHLHQDLNHLVRAEALWLECMKGREMLFGVEHPDTLCAAFSLAEALSALNRQAEAIPFRRRELAWCCKQNSEFDFDTFQSIHCLATDLSEVGEMEEAEALFRELLARCPQVLENSDPGNARVLSALANILATAGRMEEALSYASKALEHCLEHGGADYYFTNHVRFDLAFIQHVLGQVPDSLSLLEEMWANLCTLQDPDKEELQLLVEVYEALESIRSES
jgi:tetratricopeptide (TPR) repeat protein